MLRHTGMRLFRTNQLKRNKMEENYKATTWDGDELEEKSIRRKKLMYLHGFGSSAVSGTVKTLRELLPDFDVVAPDIPVESFRLFLLRASAKSQRTLSLLSACRRLIQQRLCPSCEDCV